MPWQIASHQLLIRTSHSETPCRDLTKRTKASKPPHRVLSSRQRLRAGFDDTLILHPETSAILKSASQLTIAPPFVFGNPTMIEKQKAPWSRFPCQSLSRGAKSKSGPHSAELGLLVALPAGLNWRAPPWVWGTPDALSGGGGVSYSWASRAGGRARGCRAYRCSL